MTFQPLLHECELDVLMVAKPAVDSALFRRISGSQDEVPAMRRHQIPPLVVGFHQPEPLIQFIDLNFLAEKLNAFGQQAQHDRLDVILREKGDQLFSPRN